MNFRDWLIETGTSTGDVAIFSRPMGSVNRRMYPPSITFGEEGNKKKKKKKSNGPVSSIFSLRSSQPQVSE